MFKKIIFIELIILIIVLILASLISNKIYSDCKEVIVKNNAFILNESKSDKEIITIIKDIEIDNVSLEEINKYGYEVYEIPKLRNKIYLNSYLISICIYLLLVTLFNILKYKENN